MTELKVSLSKGDVDNKIPLNFTKNSNINTSVICIEHYLKFEFSKIIKQLLPNINNFQFTDNLINSINLKEILNTENVNEKLNFILCSLLYRILNISKVSNNINKENIIEHINVIVNNICNS